MEGKGEMKDGNRWENENECKRWKKKGARESGRSSFNKQHSDSKMREKRGNFKRKKGAQGQESAKVERDENKRPSCVYINCVCARALVCVCSHSDVPVLSGLM